MGTVVFSKKTSATDEWYTPENAIYPILKYIPIGSTIWCPFDLDHSNYVKIFKRAGFKVINSHLETGGDFFNIQVPECDLIISNPPFSLRDEIFKKCIDMNMPFMLLMNTNGFLDSKKRWFLFKENIKDITLLYLQGRVNYMKEYGVEEKGSPPFQSMYISYNINQDQLVLDDRYVDRRELRKIKRLNSESTTSSS